MGVDDADALYPARMDPTFSDDNWISLGGLPGVNGGVNAAVLDGADNLYIGGFFSTAGNILANCIAKWNGTAWSALGSGRGGPPPVSLLRSVTISEERIVGLLFGNGGQWPVTRAQQCFGRQGEDLLAHLLPGEVPGLIAPANGAGE